jgi:hypothetical protein
MVENEMLVVAKHDAGGLGFQQVDNGNSYNRSKGETRCDF